MAVDTLRVLLVNSDSRESERILAMFGREEHDVLPAATLDEAEEALSIQKFDTVVLASPLEEDSVVRFTQSLRNLEKKQRASKKTIVLLVAPYTSPPFLQDPCIDGYLARDFKPADVVSAVTCLAAAPPSCEKSTPGARNTDLPLFEPEGFKEQVAYDSELLVEIINLFLAERLRQIPEMLETLASGDYDKLSRIAHTVKGSLGSLHATRARFHAQTLESAAKARDSRTCQEAFENLEHDLDALVGELLRLREEVTA